MKVTKVKAELKTIGTVDLNPSTMLPLPGTVQYYLSDRLSILFESHHASRCSRM